MIKITSQIEDIKIAIPELDQITNYNNLKTISYQSWDNRIKAIVTKNLNKYGKSLSWASLTTYFNPCIIELNSSYNTITFNEFKYKLIRQHVMSEEFVLK